MLHCVVFLTCLSATLQAAFAIFATMQPQGIKPTILTFHTLLKGSGHLKAAVLQELYAQMLGTRTLVLTDVTFHYVLRAAVKCSNGLPASWLFQVLHWKLWK